MRRHDGDTWPGQIVPASCGLTLRPLKQKPVSPAPPPESAPPVSRAPPPESTLAVSPAPPPESASELVKALTPVGGDRVRYQAPPSGDRARSLPHPQLGPSSDRERQPLPQPAPARDCGPFRQPLPQLPQLWASQPRSMTPNSSFAESSRCSASVTPSSVPAVDIANTVSGQNMRPPLRRMESDPVIHRGYIDPTLRLRESPGLAASKSMRAPSAADRYSTTFTFG